MMMTGESNSYGLGGFLTNFFMFFYCFQNYRDEFDNSDDEGSISLDEDNDSDADIFESDSDEEDHDSNADDVSDPEDDQPKKKRMKPISSKDFQKKLKHTNSKFNRILFLLCFFTLFLIPIRYEFAVCGC